VEVVGGGGWVGGGGGGWVGGGGLFSCVIHQSRDTTEGKTGGAT